MACIEKLYVMNSTTGRSPAKAAPTPIPANPISVIGVSLTRSSPYFFHKPLVTFKEGGTVEAALRWMNKCRCHKVKNQMRSRKTDNK